MSFIYQKLDGDKNIDTILIDAKYDDIELMKENDALVIQAYQSSPERYLAVTLGCLFTERQDSEDHHTFTATLHDCFALNSLYYVRTNDGVVFSFQLTICCL